MREGGDKRAGTTKVYKVVRRRRFEICGGGHVSYCPQDVSVVVTPFLLAPHFLARQTSEPAFTTTTNNNNNDNNDTHTHTTNTNDDNNNNTRYNTNTSTNTKTACARQKL